MTRIAATFLSGAALLWAAPALAQAVGGKTVLGSHFDMADVDGSGAVERAEFIDHAARHGISADRAEARFEALAGPNRALSRDAFGSFDPEELKGEEVNTGAIVRSGPTRGLDTFDRNGDGELGVSEVMRRAPERPLMGNAPGFGMYDTDGDGRVSFLEYSVQARKQGMGSTRAAQRFVKMAEGRSYLDRDTFERAMVRDPADYDRPTVRERDGSVRGFDFDRDYRSTGFPRATLDRMDTPERRRLGDLDDTPAPRMQVWGEDEPEGSLLGISD